MGHGACGSEQSPLIIKSHYLSYFFFWESIGQKKFLDTSKTLIFPNNISKRQTQISLMSSSILIPKYHKLVDNNTVLIIGIKMYNLKNCKWSHLTVYFKWQLRRSVYQLMYTSWWMVKFAIFHLQTVFVQMIRTPLFIKQFSQVGMKMKQPSICFPWHAFKFLKTNSYGKDI